MTALSDTLTVSLVLVLLFGSIALYLYTRIQQAEQRINLLDSIVLELKMSSEVKSYTELPASDEDYDIEPNKYQPSATTISSNSSNSAADYKPFDDGDGDDVEENDIDSQSQASSISSKHSKQQEHNKEVDDVEFYKSILDSHQSQQHQQQQDDSKPTKVSVTYEAMNIKELHALAKQRGITGATTMKKQAIIDALKGQDKGSSVEPGSMGASSLSSFLETSAFLGQNDTPARTVTIDDE